MTAREIKFDIPAGTKPSICHGKGHGCGATIYFIRHAVTGNIMPVNPDGTSHFATCPKAPLYRRAGKIAAARRKA